MKKAPVRGHSRHGQVAQAATAVRSKDTMLFAVMHIRLGSRIPVMPHKWSIRESNPSVD